ncbi:MAG: ADOP family duplicated permease [Gemmatimonadales bacterium]
MRLRGVALRVYRLCARVLLPPAFRREYGAELEEAVAARLDGRGAAGTVLVLLAEVGDLVGTAWRERGQDPTETGGGMVEALADLRTGARNLVRRPGLAVAAALTIALGIGATTTVYSVVDGVVLRPLPYENPSTLVAVGAIAPGAAADPATGLQDLTIMSSVDLEGLRERARSYEALGALSAYRLLESDENGVEEYVPAARVSAEIFSMLGVAPTLGRTFSPDEFEFTGTFASPPVVMISHGYWQRRYGGDPSALGRTLESQTAAAGAGEGSAGGGVAAGPRPTIVGILPEDFEPPETFFRDGELPEVYAPLVLPSNAGQSPERRAVLNGISGLGRLRAGTSVEQARAEAAVISQELATSDPMMARLPGGRNRTLGVNDLHADTVGTAGRTLWAFLASAGLLLLLTMMNAATLLLARALDRRQELGVRVALGAGRGRVMRLLVGEAGLLALAGGATGVLLAYLGVATFLRFAPPTIPRLGAVAVDGRVLLVAVAATIATGITAGLVPAFGFLRRNAWAGLQTGSRAVSDPASRVRSVLVGAQLALAMVLLCGAGLLFSSFMRIRAADPGFEPEGLVVMSPAPVGPIQISRASIAEFYRRWDPVLSAQAAVPGVRSVAGASAMPFQAPTWAPRILLPGDGPEVAREGIAGYAITHGYLETMGIEVRAGRGFGPEDGPDAEDVALVNEAFVRTQLGGGNAVGMIVTRDPEGLGVAPEAIPMRIVGVVEDVVQARAEDGPRPAVYIPYSQAAPQQLLPWWSVVRTDRAAEDVIPELRASMSGLQIRSENVSTMGDRIAGTEITPRFQAMLIGSFAFVALLLAAVGLHGSLAHTVRRRQRELGVRMALGADRASVLRMVMRQGMRLSAVGLVLGLVGTLALTRVLASFLFDMQPWDPPTLLAVAAVLLLVCAAACLAPARRATAVDPVKVLQAE